jgi:hypothetical protein
MPQLVLGALAPPPSIKDASAAELGRRGLISFPDVAPRQLQGQKHWSTHSPDAVPVFAHPQV